MKVTDKFLLKTYIGPFILTFMVMLFILLMQFLWKYVDDLVGKGLELFVLLKLLFYSAFTFVPLALPLSVLLSSLITFGNLSERNELTALKSAGIPLFRIMRPLTVFAVAISIVAFVFANNVVPVMSLKFTVLLHDIQAQKPALSIDEGIFYRGIDNYIIRIGKKDKDNSTIYDVLIYDHTRNNGYATLTYGKKGRMELSDNKQTLLFTLEDGFIYDENVQYDASLRSTDMPLLRGTFKSQQVKFDLSSFKLQHTSEDFYKDSYEMLNVLQLDRYIDTMRRDLYTLKSRRGSDLLLNLRSLSNLYTDTLQRHYADTLSEHIDFTISQKSKIYEYAVQSSRENMGLMEFNMLDYDSQQKQMWRYEIEWHRKFSLSIACLLLFFIGVPLGAIIRKGGLGIPLTVSILVFVVYWVTSTMGERMSRIGTIPPYFGMWISTLLLLPLGIFLVYKASTEAGLSDLSALKVFLDKLSAKNPLRKLKQTYYEDTTNM
ncbi:MAG: LptF/LptG family permease [Bacteroidales bacterium]|nr:LptF/LptG family permease [Bacteroidales bacterium]